MPELADLKDQMKTQLQNWIASSVLTTMGYDVTIDTTASFDDAANPSAVYRD